MLVPLYFRIAMSDLNKPNASLGKPSREQALSSEVTSHRLIEAVESQRGLGLVRDIFNDRRFILHPKREFKRIEPRLKLIVEPGELLVVDIQCSQEVQLVSLSLGCHSSIAGVFELRCGRRQTGVAQGGALIGARKKCRTPVLDAAVRERRTNRYEPR